MTEFLSTPVGIAAAGLIIILLGSLGLVIQANTKSYKANRELRDKHADLEFRMAEDKAGLQLQIDKTQAAIKANSDRLDIEARETVQTLFKKQDAIIDNQTQTINNLSLRVNALETELDKARAELAAVKAELAEVKLSNTAKDEQIAALRTELDGMPARLVEMRAARDAANARADDAEAAPGAPDVAKGV